MTEKYNSIRTRNKFCPQTEKPFKLSRSKIHDFMKCPRCFYLDRKCGTSQPPSFPFTLNNAVDALLKKEFDIYRAEGKAHPLCIENGINAIPYAHPDLENWRLNQKGIQYLHEPTNFMLMGAIDDVWVNPEGELIIVDYKATSSKNEITLDEEYRQAYKKQMEFYQWLFRKNGFKVSNMGYFVYCNGDTSKNSFQGNLEFKILILPYKGDGSWIEETLEAIKACLIKSNIPEPSTTCTLCSYWAAVNNHLRNQPINS